MKELARRARKHACEESSVDVSVGQAWAWTVRE